MSVAKEPLRAAALAKLDAAARTDEISDWDRKAYLALRYTGMHSACLYRPESEITEEMRNGIIHIVWSRPMKGAKKGQKNYWRKVAGVPKSRFIDFDMREFYLHNIKNKRKYPAWKQKIHYAIHRIGTKADFTDVSPNTLRHSFLMEMLEVYENPKKDVAAMAGCSMNTLEKHYNSLGAVDRARLLKEKGW